MIKAIIFDCYGVLLGHGFWHTYAAAGGDIRADKDFVHSQLHAMNEGELSSEQFDEIIAAKLSIDIDRWQAIKRAQELPNMQLLHYIRDELKPAFKIGMITNAGSGTIERKLIPQQLDLFDVRIVSAEVGLIKPDKEIYQLAAERLGAATSECVFVDDYPKYARAAENSGMRGIVYANFEDFEAKIIAFLKAS